MVIYSHGSSLRKAGWFILVVSLLFLFSACSGQDETEPVNLDKNENYIVQCEGDCSAIAASIIELGGSVNKRYVSVNALAITIPIVKVNALEKISGIRASAKEQIIKRPVPQNSLTLDRTLSAQIKNIDKTSAVSLSNLHPNNFLFNATLTGVESLHARDILGSGVVVAIIDSGVANNADVVPALDGNVIGGESFIDLPDEPSATSIMNDSHGTWVGSMIAAHLGLVIPNDDPFVEIVRSHSPESVIPESDTESMVPMLGAAPDASLYALKVFAATQESTSSSIVLDAMDRVLTLKRNFNEGVPSVPIAGDGTEDKPFVYDSLNIEVVNLSLGGPTLFPGLELEDIIVREMTLAGITVVTAAGNEGWAAMTGGSPGTSVASVNIAALTTPTHERILRDLQFGAGVGEQFRPNDTIQTAYFSSRGPTADGRVGLQLATNGFASFVQGADGNISFVSGTSLAAPTATGAAALLHQAYPDATAAAIRDAMTHSANAAIITDNNIAIDRGMGFLDMVQAVALLDSDDVEDEVPPLPELGSRPSRVTENIKAAGVETIPLNDGETYTMDVTLIPGQVQHFFIPTLLTTEQIHFDISNFSTELSPDAQNAIFGDAFSFTVNDAPTSINDILLDERIESDAAFDIDKPQTGIVRAAIMGDWTNAGKVSATIQISAKQRRLVKPYVRGSLRDEETDVFRLRIGRNVSQINFELSWWGDWNSYPPHDIDLIVIDPADEPYFDGATLDIPERLSIDDPSRGRWTIMVTGFMLHGFRDRYELRITDQNGRSLRDDDD